jgi:hypothetical protein
MCIPSATACLKAVPFNPKKAAKRYDEEGNRRAYPQSVASKAGVRWPAARYSDSWSSLPSPEKRQTNAQSNQDAPGRPTEHRRITKP